MAGAATRSTSDSASRWLPASAKRWVPASARRAYLVSVGAAAALGGIYHLDPEASGPILCPYRALTGLPCPGCGLTRATHYLLRGDLATAWAYNPLLFLAMPLALAFALAPLAVSEPEATRWRTRLGWLALGLTLAFWVWRNTALYPFLRL